MQVVELISTAISDFMEAEFIGERDNQGNPIPNADITMVDWEEKNFLAAGERIVVSVFTFQINNTTVYDNVNMTKLESTVLSCLYSVY